MEAAASDAGKERSLCPFRLHKEGWMADEAHVAHLLAGGHSGQAVPAAAACQLSLTASCITPEEGYKAF